MSVNVRHLHIWEITLPSLISKQLQLLFFFVDIDV